MTDKTADIVIAGAARTPMGAFQGELAPLAAPELGGAAIAGAIRNAGLDKAAVDEVIMGCVLPAGVGQAPARQAGFAAGLGEEVPASTLNKVCGSGMKTVMMAHDLVRAGSAGMVVAGGMESMTNAPYLSPAMRGGARLGDVRRVDERRERVGAHKAFFRIGFRKRSVFPEQLAQTREARDGGAARRDAPRDVGARARPVGAFARGARLEDGIRHDVVRLEVRRRGPFRGVQERRAGDAVFRRAPCRRAPPRLREHGVALNLEKRRRRVRQHVAPLEHERVPQPRDALAGQRVGAELGEPPRAQQAGAHARVRAGFRRVRQLPRHRLVEGEALGEQTGVAREKKPGRDVLGEARQHPEALLLILRHKQQNAGDRARRRAVEPHQAERPRLSLPNRRGRRHEPCGVDLDDEGRETRQLLVPKGGRFYGTLLHLPPGRIGSAPGKNGETKVIRYFRTVISTTPFLTRVARIDRAQCQLSIGATLVKNGAVEIT